MCGAGRMLLEAEVEAGVSGSASSSPTGPGGRTARRVTSILFGDLVGFTALAERRDQEDVRELLGRFFESAQQVVHRYGGVVEKFIGDAVMAVWGVPTAHEDDAERAVRAGLELVAAVAGLRDEVDAPGLDLRVGIVTGEVAVSLGAEGHGMVAGDAVNTAARVESAAAPGQVWVDELTRSLTRRSIDFIGVGEHVLKGKADPVPLWAVRAVVAAADGSQRADGLEAPLVGRERELRLIKELFHRTAEKGSPSLLILSGEAGIGKSRLAWEFEKYSDGLPAATMWHTGRCAAYGERVPYHALAETIRARLRLALHSEGVGTPDDIVARDGVHEDPEHLLQSAVHELVENESEREWIIPRLGALLGIGSLGEFVREDLFAAWTAFFRRLSQHAESVVIQIDDAEYADESLVRFVEHLMGARFPVFVMVMGRPSLLEDYPELTRNPQSTLVNLAPLTDVDIRQLLDGLVDGLPAGLREDLAARSEGVPLYAVETVRSLIDRDLVVPADDRYVLTDRDVDLSTIGAPASLQALIAARLDGVTETERRVVEAACVLGQTFHKDHLEWMLGEASDLDATLSRLERGQLIVRETNRWSADYGQFRFVQAVVPHVAYSMLARRDRRAAHLRAVELFSEAVDGGVDLAPVIADHLIKAVEAVPDAPDVMELREGALQSLCRAADRAEALGAIEESAAYLTVARSLTEDPLVRARLDLRRGLAFKHVYSNTAAIAILEPLVAIFDDAGDEAAAGIAAGALGSCLAEIGRIDEARALVETRWSALRERAEAGDAIVELASAMCVLYEGGDTHPFAEAIFEVGLRRGDDALVTRGLRQLAYYYFHSRDNREVARLLYEDCLRRDGGSPVQRSINLTNLTTIWMVDDVSVAAGYATEAVRLIDDLGVIGGTDIVLTNSVNSLLLTGAWDQALTVASRGSELRDPVNTVALDLATAIIRRARGQQVPAPAWNDADVESGAEWHRAYGRTERALRLGSRSTVDHLSSAVHALKDYLGLVGLADDHAVIWPVLFDLARATHDPAAVQALLDMIGEDEADRSIATAFRAHRHRALGLLAGDRGEREQASVRLGQAVTCYDEWHAPALAAKARAERASVLLGSRDPGEVSEGVELLRDAHVVLDGLGASGWLAELDGSGAHWPPRSGSGPYKGGATLHARR